MRRPLRPARRAACATLLLGLAGGACRPEPALLVRVLGPGGRPVPGIEVIAFPLDPDLLLDSLSAEAPTPRPTFPALEAEMRAFSSPAGDRAHAPGTTGHAWLATRDSVEALADSIRALDRASLAYREAYQRLRELYQRLGQRMAEADRAGQDGLRAARDLAQRAAQAADALRQWEQIAYATLPDRLARALKRSGRDIRRGITDSTGTVGLHLEPGRWWVQARTRVPDNPFWERRWNVPVTINRLVPVHLPLAERTAVLRWRH